MNRQARLDMASVDLLCEAMAFSRAGWREPGRRVRRGIDALRKGAAEVSMKPIEVSLDAAEVSLDPTDEGVIGRD